MATLIRMDIRGVMHLGSSLFFVYLNGGVERLDLGVCDQAWGLTPSLELQNPYFSDDGKTFYCTVALSEDVYSMYTDDTQIVHEKGIYHITIDVDTCQYQLQKEELP